MTRRETARYLTQGEGWTPSSGCAEGSRSFTDVHCGDQDWQAIETFYDQGISGGCGGSNFCPDSTATRGQMMVFLLKVAHGTSFDPGPCVGNVFTDVTCAGQFDAWIEQAYQEGLTAGCGTGIFCPNNNVTEYQMAAYLDKTQICPGYRPIPGGSWYTLRDEGNRVVTEFYESFPGRDNVYLGNLLVASYVSHANSGTTGWNFHTTDHLGTVRLTVNGATGGTIESLKYWPYGDRVGSTGVPVQKMAFASMERDGENNHYYDHARKHDFNLGRFVSPDVLGGGSESPQSWNRYTYAGNNPLKYVDPDGKRLALATLVSQQTLDRNAQIRSDVSSYLERTGNGLFRPATDFVLSNFLPQSYAEVSANFLGSVVGLAGPMKMPTLQGSTGGQLFKEALGHVAALKGTGAQKASMFEALAAQATDKTGGAFQAMRVAGPDGASIFVGPQGDALVISKEGQIFRGKLGEGVEALSSKEYKLHYGKLKSYVDN